MLYRAVGEDNISRLGYAVSSDGFNFSRFDKPVLEPERDFETYGCEDPRITKIGETFYVVYTGVGELGSVSRPWKVRVCMVSTKDFFKWERYGVVIPDINNKDAAIFPERAKDKYLMLHRIDPDI